MLSHLHSDVEGAGGYEGRMNHVAIHGVANQPHPREVEDEEHPRGDYERLVNVIHEPAHTQTRRITRPSPISYFPGPFAHPS